MNIREKNIVSKMIRIYCHSKHNQQNTLCSDCLQLENYAHKRLEHCPFGESKPACRKCTIHCYKPELRQRIQEIMRFSGPRMLLYHPTDVLLHLWKVLLGPK